MQFESLRVPLAEGGLGYEAFGVGDGGRAGGEPGGRQLSALAAQQARSVRQAAPARAGTSATSAATSAQRPKIQSKTCPFFTTGIATEKGKKIKDYRLE